MTRPHDEPMTPEEESLYARGVIDQGKVTFFTGTGTYVHYLGVTNRLSPCELRVEAARLLSLSADAVFTPLRATTGEDPAMAAWKEMCALRAKAARATASMPFLPSEYRRKP